MNNCLFLQGPSGVGKSTLARSLSESLGWVHLDRDYYRGTRDEIYQEMHRKLKTLLGEGREVIVDAPFLYEDADDFATWLSGIDNINYKVATLQLVQGKRKERRLARNSMRDRIDNWKDTLDHEDRVFEPIKGSLLLDGAAPLDLQKEAVLWHLGTDGRKIRKARLFDLSRVLSLKYEILEESFAHFLSPRELQLELEQVVSSSAVSRMIQEDEVFLAEQDGEIKALLAWSAPREIGGKMTRKIFSGYSTGNYAGVSLALYLVSQANAEDITSLEAHVYRDNERSKKVLRSFGFSPSGDDHINPRIPRVPVEHWYLD